MLLSSLGSDLGPNLLSEAIGIVIQTAIIGVIVSWILRRREQQRWAPTRKGAGEHVGWAHTALWERVRASDNAFLALYEWADSTLSSINEAKERYGYSFTANMASTLEEYEADVAQTQGSVQSRQYRNFDSLEMTNDALVAFVAACGVGRHNYEEAHIWRPHWLSAMQEALGTSEPNDSRIPPVDPQTPIRM